MMSAGDSKECRFEMQSNSIELTANLIEWDANVFGFSVAQIDYVRLKNSIDSLIELDDFWSWVDRNSINLISCRLNHSNLSETIFLEDNNFKFIEMVLHPTFKDIQNFEVINDDSLIIKAANEEDLHEISDIAESVFNVERFHADPRVPSKLANIRYKNWVVNSARSSNQKLLKITQYNNIIGFFLVESLGMTSVYWHLTAISHKYQAKGFGLKVWRAMINYHKIQGFNQIKTTISARNTRVLNLYAKLGCSFTEPEMTFHWLKNNASFLAKDFG
jgi:RimJ/RimL family protein N-acetyltransferase